MKVRVILKVFVFSLFGKFTYSNCEYSAKGFHTIANYPKDNPQYFDKLIQYYSGHESIWLSHFSGKYLGELADSKNIKGVNNLKKINIGRSSCIINTKDGLVEINHLAGKQYNILTCDRSDYLSNSIGLIENQAIYLPVSIDVKEVSIPYTTQIQNKIKTVNKLVLGMSFNLTNDLKFSSKNFSIEKVNIRTIGSDKKLYSFEYSLRIKGKFMDSFFKKNFSRQDKHRLDSTRGKDLIYKATFLVSDKNDIWLIGDNSQDSCEFGVLASATKKTGNTYGELPALELIAAYDWDYDGMPDIVDLKGAGSSYRYLLNFKKYLVVLERIDND